MTDEEFREWFAKKAKFIKANLDYNMIPTEENRQIMEKARQEYYSVYED